MSNRKYFGTDGIRGRVGDAPITPDFVLKLGWAAGKVLARHGSRKIIIGKDTRISGYMLESALEAGLAAAGLSASFRADAYSRSGISDPYVSCGSGDCHLSIA
jgi:phosphoglucosamine mutase